MSEVNALDTGKRDAHTVESDAQEVLAIVQKHLTKVSLTKEIVQSSPEQRREYFEERTVLHANMNRVFLEVWDLLHLLRRKKNELLVFIFGPSGVGKSALRKLLALLYLMEHLEELNARKEWIPLTQNELVQRSERYSWREFYRGGLLACQDPLPDCKILPRGEMNNSYIPTGKASIDLWGNAYADASAIRGVGDAFVDEADKLAKIPFRDKESATNPLIGLSRICPHYLFGTYTLLEVRNRNGQIARRSKSFHFPRYHFGVPEEYREFQKALNGLTSQLPVQERPDLTAHSEYILQRSNGCVGILHDWLANALDLAIRENAQTITLQHLRRTQLDDDSLARLEAEAAVGEDRFLELDDEYKLTTIALGKAEEKWIERLGKLQTGNGKPSNDLSSVPRQTCKSKGKRGNRKPGQTNPRRVPVGGAIPQVRRRPDQNGRLEEK